MTQLHLGDCLEVMATIPPGSVDAVITDPPYPEIDRPYGRMTEAEWSAMMRQVVGECRRILKPSGSAVFVLQPNSRKVGSMRAWLWEFMAWCCREWNIVQDVYWWNTSALPVGGAITADLLRGSLKACVWLGSPDCFRLQSAVLRCPSRRCVSGANQFERNGSPGILTSASGRSVDPLKGYTAWKRRGGTTPFNVLDMGVGAGQKQAGAFGHPAGTPFALCDWWVRYISPIDGVVCDPFMGSGTVGVAAYARDRSFIGIERDPAYFATAQARLARQEARYALFERPTG